VRSIIIDTGPLVAYLRESDRYHEWARQQFQQYQSPLLTCEPVLTEAAFLLSRYGGTENVEPLFMLFTTGILRVTLRFSDEAPCLQELMRRYRNIPMSLADACLVRMAELHPDSTVLTLDSDFLIYRKHDREPLSLLIPNRKP
jgi:predicted nucleic acid-binding protein